MSKSSSNANAVVRSVCDLLSAHRVWWMRVNTGGLRGATRFIRFGKKGAADVLALPRSLRTSGVEMAVRQLGVDERILLYPEPVWVECKSGSGRQSPAQKEFQAEVEAAGHSYIIAHDGPEAVIEWLKDHGVI